MPLKGPGKPGRTEMEWNMQLVFYADDVNLLGDNINAIKKNTDALIDTSKEVGLEVNAEKSKYILMFHHQNAVQHHKLIDPLKMWHSTNTWK
jgi:hypothetical protein